MSWHRHVWKVVATDVRPTPFEVLSELQGHINNIRGGEWFERDVIVTRRCEKCGTEEVKRL